MTSILRRACPVIFALYLALTLAGCATTTAKPPVEPAMHSLSEIDDENAGYVYDPWEGTNRSLYNFNYRFDKYFFIPVVTGYEWITPTFVQTGVSNFFNNIGEGRTFYNSLLQLKGKKAMITLGRFLTNTTIGIAGLFDPATSFGMARQNEDFGQTLSVWGVGKGPYFVMPVLGPGTVRSTTGFVVDSGIHYAIKSGLDLQQYADSDSEGNNILAAVSVLKAIDNRHQEPFRYYDSGYPFEYYMVRFLYVEKRELAAMK